MYYSDDEWVKLISTLIVNPVLPENFTVDPALMKNPEFKKLYDYLMDIRSLSSALNRGDLQHFVYGKGFILANLKALQSNLRHLTWQTKKVADGDFSQRVDFLGEFSDAFNEMTVKLHDVTMRLTKLANMDSLTKIPNRRALEAFLVDAFKNSAENKKPFSIIIFDIDFFKSTNDTHGHDAGDAVLVEVSERLNKQFRAHDIFSRYGGDEFMAVLPGTSLSAAKKIAERARVSVEKAEIPLGANVSIRVTVSAGISERLESDVLCEDVIKKSDLALYAAKKTGRNRVCCG